MGKAIFRQLQETITTERAKQLKDIGLSVLYPEAWIDFAQLLRVPLDGQLVPFKPFDYQLEAIDAIENKSSTLIVKSRQLGFSLIICSYILFRCIKSPAFKGLVFSKTQNDSSQLCKRIKALLYTLPNPPKLVKDSAFALELEGGGQIHFLSNSENAARGFDGVSILFFDECEFIKNVQGLYDAAMPSISTVSDAKIILSSTPGSRSGFFFESFKKYRNDQRWNVLEVPWYRSPIFSRNPNFKEEIKEKYNLTESKFNREFNLSFDESATYIFNPEYVKELSVCKNYAEVDPTSMYVVGIDTSFTKGNDFFIVTVLEVNPNKPLQTAAWYKDNEKNIEDRITDTIEFLTPYNPAIIKVECNGGVGSVVIEKLTQEFPYTQLRDFYTTRPNKIFITDRLAYLIETKKILLPEDPKCIEDFEHFEDKEGKRGAAPGYNDDFPMSLSLANSCLVDEIEVSDSEEFISMEYEHLFEDYYE